MLKPLFPSFQALTLLADFKILYRLKRQDPLFELSQLFFIDISLFGQTNLNINDNFTLQIKGSQKMVQELYIKNKLGEKVVNNKKIYQLSSLITGILPIEQL